MLRFVFSGIHPSIHWSLWPCRRLLVRTEGVYQTQFKGSKPAVSLISWSLWEINQEACNLLPQFSSHSYVLLFPKNVHFNCVLSGLFSFSQCDVWPKCLHDTEHSLYLDFCCIFRLFNSLFLLLWMFQSMAIIECVSPSAGHQMHHTLTCLKSISIAHLQHIYSINNKLLCYLSKQYSCVSLLKSYT